MNRDDIIRMAREACGEPAWDGGVEWTWEEVERFANLVAAAERERIIAANAPEIEKVNVYIKTLEDAVAAEREACAKVCDELVLEHPGRADLTAKQCAFAIRERGAP